MLSLALFAEFASAVAKMILAIIATTKVGRGAEKKSGCNIVGNHITHNANKLTKIQKLLIHACLK
jgi:hypothetical protein